MFTPVAATLLYPGDKGELLFWKNNGSFWNIAATVNDESHIVVATNEANKLAKFWGFCPQPGFRKAGQGQPIYWLGDTGLDGDGRLSFIPNQTEAVNCDSMASAGRVLAEHYQAKLPGKDGARPQPSGDAPITFGPAPKVVDAPDAIKSQGFVEVEPTIAKYLTSDPMATALGSRLDQLMTYWGKETVVVIRHPELEWNGRKYREYIIAPYPIIKR